MSIDNGASDLEIRVKLFFDKCNREGMNHFKLLGISPTATHQQIKSAYETYREMFSPEKIGGLTDPEIKNKVEYVRRTIRHAYDVLIDYDKRAKYEKHGYKEPSAEDLKTEDPAEKARSHYKLGKSLYDQKAYKMAISALEEAVRTDAGRADYLLQLGKAQAKIPDLRRKAEQNFQKAIEMEPWNAEHYAAMGTLFYMEKLKHRAETYFRKALHLDPDHVLARQKLAEIAPDDKKSPLTLLLEILKKIFPTFFGRGK
jgi:tetratricopeptide (TPR) repeat protein